MGMASPGEDLEGTRIVEGGGDHPQWVQVPPG